MATLLPGETPQKESEGLSIGRRRGSSSLTGGRPCPHLVATDGKSLPYEHASQHNACAAQPRVVRKGLKKITHPNTRVVRDHQKAHCLGAFTSCEFYFPPSEAPPDMAETQKKTAEASRQRASAKAQKKPPKAKRRRAAHDPFSKSSWQSAKQLGAIGVALITLAFIVSFFFSPTASQMFGNLAISFIKSNAETMGVSREDLDRAEKAGLLKAGNLKQLGKFKTFSAKDRAQLKKSKAFKGLTKAQKAKLKRQFKKK